MRLKRSSTFAKGTLFEFGRVLAELALHLEGMVARLESVAVVEFARFEAASSLVVECRKRRIKRVWTRI